MTHRLSSSGAGPAGPFPMVLFGAVLTGLLLFCLAGSAPAQSLDIPVRGAGVSFGNSREFDGLRFNLRDREVRQVQGLNVTLWKAKDNDEAVVNGISLGLIPEAGYLTGLQVGIAGVAAGRSLTGISLGGLGAGSGDDVTGVAAAGLGAGCGRDSQGILFGGLGAGVGRDVRGVLLGGIGAGAGGNAKGLMIGGVGVGAGGDLTGIAIGGVGAGCGGKLRGLAAGLVAVGAPEADGLLLGGLGVGGEDLRGLVLAGGMLRIEPDGEFTGWTTSAFNHVRGRVTGLSIGIVNYARALNGIQLGVINIVRDNPAPFRVLPLINLHLD